MPDVYPAFFSMHVAQIHLCARRWDARRRALSSISSAEVQVQFGSTISTALAQVCHIVYFIGSALVIRELRSVSLFDVAQGLSHWLENCAYVIGLVLQTPRIAHSTSCSPQMCDFLQRPIHLDVVLMIGRLCPVPLLLLLARCRRRRGQVRAQRLGSS